MADNPYAPPTAPVKDMDATAPLINRPKSPKVIGIIFLIMSGFGLLSIIQNLYMIVRGDVAFMSVMNSISNVGVNYYYFTFLGLPKIWLWFSFNARTVYYCSFIRLVDYHGFLFKIPNL